MKKSKLLSMMMLVIIVLPIMIACSNDDSKGTSKKSGGVNVINGKKVVELSFFPGNNRHLPDIYKIDYDSKGRLSKISYEKILKDEYNSEKKEWVAVDVKNVEYVKVDYDLKVVTILLNDNYPDYPESFTFSLNDDGYISRIGQCIFSYDSFGYLKNVDELKSIGTLYYDSNYDFVKASVSKFVDSNMALYYVPYTSTAEEGIMHVHVKHSDDEYNRNHDIGKKDICFFIAYQAGLLGKVTQTVLYVKDRNEATAMFEYNTDKKVISGRITFVCK